jgi:hypothetical protein
MLLFELLQAVGIKAKGLRTGVQSFLLKLTGLISLEGLICEDGFEFDFLSSAIAGLPVILQHSLNIFDEQIGKRGRSIVVIALPTTASRLFFGDLLDLYLHFLEMLGLLGGGSRSREILILLILAVIDASQLIGIVIHDDEILEFEVHEGNILGKCVAVDEVSEEVFDVLEGVIFF